jgi:hypothetical protein
MGSFVQKNQLIFPTRVEVEEVQGCGQARWPGPDDQEGNVLHGI